MSYPGQSKRMIIRLPRRTSFFDKLPEELLQKILEKLPSISAVQCKAVCKRWLFIISDPYFAQCSVHNQHQHDQFDQNFSFLFHFYTSYGQRPPLQSTCSIPHLQTCWSKPPLLSFVPCYRELDPQPLSMVAYFMDLLVCCAQRFFWTTYYICNPLTKQWLMIPPFPTSHRRFMVGLVCYPYCCNKKQSCFTNLRYKYKLVRFPCETNSHEFTMDIFCSESGRWSQQVVSFSQPWEISFFTQLVVPYKGILHWLNKDRIIMAYDPLNNVEQCRIIDPPNCDNNVALRFHNDAAFDGFGVSGGSMRIARIANRFFHGKLSVWELEDYNSGKWRLEHEVYLEDLVPEDTREDARLVKQTISSPGDVKFVAFHPFDVDIVYLKFLPSGIKEKYILSCSLRKGTFKVACKPQFDGESAYYAVIGNFYPLVHPRWPTPVPPLDALDVIRP